jgi:predicted O-methyltransferase YrrM
MKFEDVDAYLKRVTPPRDRVMKAMETYARKHDFPIIGPLVGRFLYQMALVTRARKILELGSGFGYSAYWFSRAVGPRGLITMTDMDENNRDRTFDYFRKARLKSRFDYRLGDSLDIAAKLRGKYDILLNDIDKEDYPRTINLAARLVRPGGLFITDNLIWSGRVMDASVRDKTTAAIRTFTKRLYADRRFMTTVIPLRDGISVAVRI